MGATVALSLGGLAALTALVLKLTDFAKMLTNLPITTRAVVTQAIAWGVAIGVVFLYGASQWAPTVVISDLNLRDADGPTKLLIGLALGSSASVVQSFIQSFDNTQSAAVSPLRVGRRRPASAPDHSAAIQAARTTTWGA